MGDRETEGGPALTSATREEKIGMVAILGNGLCLDRPAGSPSIKPTYFQKGKLVQARSYRDVTGRNKGIYS